MEEIQYKKLDADCFNTHSLDSFVCHQAVTECWREVDNKWSHIACRHWEKS